MVRDIQLVLRVRRKKADGPKTTYTGAHSGAFQGKKRGKGTPPERRFPRPTSGPVHTKVCGSHLMCHVGAGTHESVRFTPDVMGEHSPNGPDMHTERACTATQYEGG